MDSSLFFFGLYSSIIGDNKLTQVPIRCVFHFFVLSIITHMNCQYCSEACVQAGKQRNGAQKYFCKTCSKYQQLTYKYAGCSYSNKLLFLKCLKAGNGLRGSLLITGVAVSTQLRWIRKWGKSLKMPQVHLLNDEYEIDELCTYVGNKKNRKWIISAISKTTGRVVATMVGNRSVKTLNRVIVKVLSLSPKAIYTDKLKQYALLIPRHIHKVKRRGINKIERYHLTLRTHVKRLNRRTLCFSKKCDLLLVLVKLYVCQFSAFHR